MQGLVLHSSLFDWLPFAQLSLPAMGFMPSCALSDTPAVMPNHHSWLPFALLLLLSFLTTGRGRLSGHCESASECNPDRAIASA